MMASWIWWIVAGLILLGVEMLTLTFFLVWLGCAAIIAGVTAVLIPVWWLPWLVFAVISVALVGLTRPIARSLHRGVSRPSNVDSMVGGMAYVIEEIDPARNRGRVRVGSEEWRARSDRVIREGVTVRTLRVEGTMLIVEPLEEPASGSTPDKERE